MSDHFGSEQVARVPELPEYCGVWLLPVVHRVASLSLRIYFRVSREGHSVPAEGPVLIVANHPNSLLDPALVLYGARRPLRFLAKADLLQHPVVGWLISGAGSIPVYRKMDDPTLMSRNAQMFEAVQRALAQGSAVGLFPEGITHSEPSIAALKTGAARIALGAAALMGHDFPIIPIGLVFRNKTEFRSRAHAIVGRQLDWRELSQRGESDVEAVRILTDRIDNALRATTINLETWADAPIVELAEAVYAAELELRPDAIERIARVKSITDALTRMRERGSSEWVPIGDELKRHGRMLRWFRITPRSLKMSPTTGAAVGWTVRRLPLALAAASGVWVVGAVLFWVPYRVTDIVGRSALKENDTVVATTKLIGGALAFAVWIVLLSSIVTLLWGVRAGLIALAVLPVVAVISVVVRERLMTALREASTFFRIARSKGLLAELRARQSALAGRLIELWRREKIA